MLEIAPSVLAAHPLYVARDVKRLVDAGIKVLHLDIMDGHFVPNISFGPAMVSSLSKEFPGIELDVHLMLAEPEKYTDTFMKAGAHSITIHSEISADLLPILMSIKRAGIKAGLSVKPGTQIDRISSYLDLIDLVLVMSVEPGFGGQKLIPDTLPKISLLRERGFTGTISVDGGVNLENSREVLSYGANRLVMGTAAFTAEDPKALFDQLLST
ncbi:MAG: ribulose-phosphate 3-epimerase [Bacillota bacterium]|nr:ribulose-phosphate 3-epimerase [Bacillota bacterium]